MNDISFYKPTPSYKEYLILHWIHSNKNITQREIATNVGVAVSMINLYLDEYEKKGLIIRKYYSTKTVEYYVTKLGYERYKALNISYLHNSIEVFKVASESIYDVLAKFYNSGYKRLYLYGAGEVAEIFLFTLIVNISLPFDILGIIDDDESKQGNIFLGAKIISFSSAILDSCDGILISSFSKRNDILKKMIINQVPNQKILHFFD